MYAILLILVNLPTMILNSGLYTITCMLLFADDSVLFTTDHLIRQAELNTLYEHSVQWGLKTDVNTVKVCVFEKRKLNRTVKCYINKE